MHGKVLSPSQIEQFIELGYTKVEGAIPREYALAAQDYLWSKLETRGVNRNDKNTWTEQMVHIRETYDDDVFQVCNTERLADAIEDLVATGRWASRGEKTSWGWWPVNFAKGAEKPWNVPSEGWHWDGIQFRHYVDSPDQGLLCLCLFSDISPQGGGTLVAEGSHKVVARFLSEQPDGLELKDGLRILGQSHPWLAELTGNAEPSDPAGNRIDRFMNNSYTDANGVQLRVVETTGSAGDVILCHPFLYHCASQNHLGVPRFMCNRTTPLRDRMNFNREHSSDYSVLETSIRNSIQ